MHRRARHWFSLWRFEFHEGWQATRHDRARPRLGAGPAPFSLSFRAGCTWTACTRCSGARHRSLSSEEWRLARLGVAQIGGETGTLHFKLRRAKEFSRGFRSAVESASPIASLPSLMQVRPLWRLWGELWRCPDAALTWGVLVLASRCNKYSGSQGIACKALHILAWRRYCAALKRYNLNPGISIVRQNTMVKRAT